MASKKNRSEKVEERAELEGKKERAFERKKDHNNIIINKEIGEKKIN